MSNATPLFRSSPYELTPYGKHVFSVQLERLEEQRQGILGQIRKTAARETPDIPSLTANLGRLHQVYLDIAHIEEILGHSDAVSIHSKSGGRIN